MLADCSLCLDRGRIPETQPAGTTCGNDTRYCTCLSGRLLLLEEQAYETNCQLSLLDRMAWDLLAALGRDGKIKTCDVGQCRECGTATTSGMVKYCLDCAVQRLKDELETPRVGGFTHE
jgi:hypothetical protein